MQLDGEMARATVLRLLKCEQFAVVEKRRLVEREHSSRVVDKNQSNVLFAHPASSHSGYNTSQNVIESVTTVGLQTVLRADVVSQENVASFTFGNHVFDHFYPLVISRHV